MRKVLIIVTVLYAVFSIYLVHSYLDSERVLWISEPLILSWQLWSIMSGGCLLLIFWALYITQGQGSAVRILLLSVSLAFILGGSLLLSMSFRLENSYYASLERERNLSLPVTSMPPFVVSEVFNMIGTERVTGTVLLMLGSVISGTALIVRKINLKKWST